MGPFDVRKVFDSRGVQIDAADFRDVTFRSTAQRLLDGIPPIDFVWRHWIPRGRVVVVVGAGGVGKSSLLTGLAVARALGQRYFLGVSVKPGATLIVLGEDYLADGERRLAAWLDFLTDGKPTREQSELVARMVSFMVLTGTETRLVTRPKRDFAPDLLTARGIAAQVRELVPRPDLVIIETVSRFGLDESNQAHAAMITSCEVITDEADAAVSLVSHSGKANSREATFDAYTARGGSALVDNARATIVFGHMPSEKKAQKLVIGREAGPKERDCYVLKLTRATHSPPQPVIILRPRSNLDQLVLEVADAPPQAVLAEQRNRRNRLLQHAVKEMAKLRIRPSKTTLRQHLPLLGGAIGFRDVADAVDDAIQDGALIVGVRSILTVGSGVVFEPPRDIETSDWRLIVPFGDLGAS